MTNTFGGTKSTFGDQTAMLGTMVATALNQLRIGREIMGATMTELTPVVECRPPPPV